MRWLVYGLSISNKIYKGRMVLYQLDHHLKLDLKVCVCARGGVPESALLSIHAFTVRFLQDLKALSFVIITMHL